MQRCTDKHRPLQRAAFLTCHHKAPLVEAALADCGLAVETLDSFDTDQLGTFSREVNRPHSAQDTALAKAKLATDLAGTRYGLGSEGSFGRDPHVGWMPWDYELLCLWDAEREYAVYALAGSGATNYAQAEVDSLEAAQAFMDKAQFPQHALIIGRAGEPWFRKGIRRRETLLDLLHTLLPIHGRVWLETDMRAHLNPLRQAVIRDAAAALAKRLSHCCPACAAPGFALARSEPGLHCEACGISTALAATHIWECPACAYAERHPVTSKAPAAHCGYCNP